jgi:hypothetical protein
MSREQPMSPLAHVFALAWVHHEVQMIRHYACREQRQIKFVKALRQQPEEGDVV